MRQELRIYTDGACLNNPGKGSWAYIVMKGNNVVTKCSGFESKTTNNRMEYLAIINAYKYILDNNLKDLSILTDSKLVVMSINQWCVKWERNNWTRFKGKEIKNVDLVMECYELSKKVSNITLKWVKGHSGIKGNELADDLCNQVLGVKKKEVKTCKTCYKINTSKYPFCSYECYVLKNKGTRTTPVRKLSELQYIHNNNPVSLNDKRKSVLRKRSENSIS